MGWLQDLYEHNAEAVAQFFEFKEAGTRRL